MDFSKIKGLKPLIKTLFFPPPKIEEKSLLSLWQDLLDGKLTYGNNFPINFNIEGFICNTLSGDTPKILTKIEVPDYDHLLTLLRDLPPALAPEVLSFMKVFHYLKYSKEVKSKFKILEPTSYVFSLQATEHVLELKRLLHKLDVEPEFNRNRINNYIGTFLYNYLEYPLIAPYLKIHKERRNFNTFLNTGKVDYE